MKKKNLQTRKQKVEITSIKRVHALSTQAETAREVKVSEVKRVSTRYSQMGYFWQTKEQTSLTSVYLSVLVHAPCTYPVVMVTVGAPRT